MTGQQLDIEERAAGAIVAWELEGWWEPRDVPGAPEETHDLDVHVLGGRTVALEVTSAGDRSLDELRRLLFQDAWEAGPLRHHWWLGLTEQPRPQVKSLMAKIVRHLETLERNDVEQVSTLDPSGSAQASPEVEQAARAIFDLGVRRATRLDMATDGEARLHSSLGSAFSVGDDALNPIVERCAEKKADKLLDADGDERHLLVWLHSEAYRSVELAIAEVASPSAPPALPNGIDVVWVAMGPPDPCESTLGVWRVRPPANWEQVRAPRSRAG